MTSIRLPLGQLLRSRVGRRQFVGGGAAAAVSIAAASVVGCGTGAGEPGPRRGGTLRTGTSLPLASGLDPQTENATGLAIFPRVYGYPLHVDPRDETTILDHVASIEQPDPTVYVLRLRDNVRFHDVPPVNGRAVAADDIVRSVERYRDNPLATAKTFHETMLDTIAAPNPATVLVTTRRPYAYTLSALGDINAGAIIPGELIESHADLTDAGIGSGPFSIAGVSLGGVTRLSRNDGYFREPVPYLDAMEWRVYANDAEKLEGFRVREVGTAPIRDQREANDARALGKDVQLATEPSLGYLSLGLRCDRMPFADARVRRAIDLALDRTQLIADAVDGDAEPLGPINHHLAGRFWSLTAEEVAGASGATMSYDERLTEARQLLIAAAVPTPSFRLKVAALPQLIDVAEAVRRQLAALGATVAVERAEVLNWFTSYRSGDFDALLISQPPWESPNLPPGCTTRPGRQDVGAPSRSATPESTPWSSESWGQVDREERRRTLLEAQRSMLDARPMLQLFTGTSYSAAHANVRGLEPELPGSLQQYSYEQWLA